jgi:hypothetical protein
MDNTHKHPSNASKTGLENSFLYDIDPIVRAVAELKESIITLQRMQDEHIPLSETIAYDLAYPRPFGFVMVRHVTSKATDYYWKECYTCIRKWYDDPILIVDDNSDPAFLIDNMALVNCQTVYDTEWKGCGELLGYYYFHRLKPFCKAMIIHDSVFIQKRISIEVGNTMKFLWTFTGQWDHELERYYHELCQGMPVYDELMTVYQQRAYRGCFGLMSVIQWDFVDQLAGDGLFLALDQIKGRRDARSALERVLGLMAFRRDPLIGVQWGEIHSYMRWGTTFLEYLSGSVGPMEVVKVWTGR